MSKIYGVNFREDGKVYNFLAEEFECPINVTVVVETEKGLQFGKVVKLIEDEDIELSNLKKIIRISTKKDYEQYLDNLKVAKEAIIFARERSLDLDLNMNIIDASFTFDRKQLLLNFIADKRVDFRELAKDLAAITSSWCKG